MESIPPTHGYTRHGHAVHGRTIDHHRDDTAYARFNKRVASAITANVGTMTCCWVFLVVALCSLPATLVLAHVVKGSTFNIAGLYIASAGLVLLVTWTAQSFLQLVLLPAIMVGQQLQNAASDARSAKQFEDIERVKEDVTVALDRLDAQTVGGLRDVMDRIDALGRTLAKQEEASDGTPTGDR